LWICYPIGECLIRFRKARELWKRRHDWGKPTRGSAATRHAIRHSFHRMALGICESIIACPVQIWSSREAAFFGRQLEPRVRRWSRLLIIDWFGVIFGLSKNQANYPEAVSPRRVRKNRTATVFWEDWFAEKGW
jgi:hypothetical protein